MEVHNYDRTPANFLVLLIDNAKDVTMKVSVESFLKNVILIPG